MLFVGCVKKKVEFVEERVWFPSDCVCKEYTKEELDHFVCIGQKRFADLLEKLQWCKSAGMIDDLPE